jgi:hypothetical protein
MELRNINDHCFDSCRDIDLLRKECSEAEKVFGAPVMVRVYGRNDVAQLSNRSKISGLTNAGVNDPY